MSSLAAQPLAEDDDNMGASAARIAAEKLIEAAEHVKSLTGAESPAMLAGLQMRLTDAIVAAERLEDRQLSAAVIRESGWNDCLASRRGLSVVR